MLCKKVLPYTIRVGHCYWDLLHWHRGAVSPSNTYRRLFRHTRAPAVIASSPHDFCCVWFCCDGFCFCDYHLKCWQSSIVLNWGELNAQHAPKRTNWTSTQNRQNRIDFVHMLAQLSMPFYISKWILSMTCQNELHLLFKWNARNLVKDLRLHDKMRPARPICVVVCLRWLFIVHCHTDNFNGFHS